MLEKGAASDNPSTAISIGEEGVRYPTSVLIVQDNTFTSLLPTPTAFVRNGSAAPAVLFGNRLHGLVLPLEGLGGVRP